MNKKYNDNQIIELHAQGLTDKEIAGIIGVSPNCMATKRHKLGLSPNKSSRDTYVLSEQDTNILVGILLGDATIRYVHQGCKYPNLTFSHATKQTEYFEWLSNKLSNLKSSSNIYDTTYVRTNGETAQKVVFTGKNMKCLVSIRDIFYPGGIKIIPISFLQRNFNELSLYCLFMDDGSYDINSNSYIINTQCFSKENLEQFCKFLKVRFDLEFSIKQDRSLYLKHKCNDQFKKMLSSLNECPSMSYKYEGRHKTPLNRETPNSDLDNPVLNPQEIGDNAERLEVMPNK